MNHNLIFLFQEQLDLHLNQVHPRLMEQLRSHLVWQNWWAEIIGQVQREFGE